MLFNNLNVWSELFELAPTVLCLMCLCVLLFVCMLLFVCIVVYVLCLV